MNDHSANACVLRRRCRSTPRALHEEAHDSDFGPRSHLGVRRRGLKVLANERCRWRTHRQQTEARHRQPALALTLSTVLKSFLGKIAACRSSGGPSLSLGERSRATMMSSRQSGFKRPRRKPLDSLLVRWKGTAAGHEELLHGKASSGRRRLRTSISCPRWLPVRRVGRWRKRHAVDEYTHHDQNTPS